MLPVRCLICTALALSICIFSNASAQIRMVAPPGAQAVSIIAADRTDIAGWYWPAVMAPRQKLAPGVLLLHMRGRDKTSWGSLPQTLRDEGYSVLAIDLRGHGETVNAQGVRLPLESLSDADYQAMLLDVEAAVLWLRQQPGVDSERSGIIGASIGASLGVLYAAQDRKVRTVVCLSPGLGYRGLQPLPALTAYDKRPLYLIAARGDRESYSAAEALRDSATLAKPASLRGFDGSEHGTELLRAHPGLDKTITTGWLLNYLPPAR